MSVDGERCLDAAARIAPGAVVVVDATAPKLANHALPASAIVHCDSDLVVVDKRAGMLSVADESGTRDTVADHLRTLLRKLGRGDSKLGVVHRLDKDTSGLMVFARNASAQRDLAARFRAHDIERVYHAIAHGNVDGQSIETDLVLDRGDGLRGSFGHFRRMKGDAPPDARHSITDVVPLRALNGATLVECRLHTGRQHQIRIHLSERGHPIVGEPVYIRDYNGPVIRAARTMLHARVLGFEHPRGGAAMRFEREPPEDFRLLLQRLSTG